MHDPATFKDPDQFRPERFIRNGKLDTTLRDPAAFIFGYGRRYVLYGSCWDMVGKFKTIVLPLACPGRLFADTTHFLAISSIAATLQGSQPRGKCYHTRGDISFRID